MVMVVPVDMVMVTRHDDESSEGHLFISLTFWSFYSEIVSILMIRLLNKNAPTPKKKDETTETTHKRAAAPWRAKRVWTAAVTTTTTAVAITTLRR
jgi:hypothetical protein